MPHHRHEGGAAPADEAPSPRPSAAGCYAFLTRSHRAAGGYRRLDSPSSTRELEDGAAVAAEPAEMRSEGGGRGLAEVVGDADAGGEEGRDADSGGGDASG